MATTLNFLMIIAVLFYFIMFMINVGPKAVITMILTAVTVGIILFAAVYVYDVWQWNWDSVIPADKEVYTAPGIDWWPEEWNYFQFPDPLNIFLACLFIWVLCILGGKAVGLALGFVILPVVSGLTGIYLMQKFILCSSGILNVIGMFALLAFIIFVSGGYYYMVKHWNDK